jgi:hypothetical protein
MRSSFTSSTSRSYTKSQAGPLINGTVMSYDLGQAQGGWQTKHSICCNLIILVIYRYTPSEPGVSLSSSTTFLKHHTQTNKQQQQGSDALQGDETAASVLTVTPTQGVTWHTWITHGVLL